MRQFLFFCFALTSFFTTNNCQAQQVFPIGNPTAMNRSLGEYAPDSALRAPTGLKVYPWWDSAGNLAISGGVLYYHSGYGGGWKALTTSSSSGTVTSVTV